MKPDADSLSFDDPILGKSREAGGDAATLRRIYAGRCYEKLKYVPRVYLRRERRGLVARISIALCHKNNVDFCNGLNVRLWK